MSVYRTIGPLVLILAPIHRLWVHVRCGSRIFEKGVQMWKKGVRLHGFIQNVLKFPMKMK